MRTQFPSRGTAVLDYAQVSGKRLLLSERKGWDGEEWSTLHGMLGGLGRVLVKERSQESTLLMVEAQNVRPGRVLELCPSPLLCRRRKWYPEKRSGLIARDHAVGMASTGIQCRVLGLLCSINAFKHWLQSWGESTCFKEHLITKFLHHQTILLQFAFMWFFLNEHYAWIVYGGQRAVVFNWECFC